MYLKIEILYLSDSGNGQVTKTEVCYISEYLMHDETYHFCKDLPEEIRVFFKSATVNKVEDDEEKDIWTIKLPNRKPLKLSFLNEDYEEEVLVEYIKNKLLLRFKLICRFEDVFDTLIISKGKEIIEYSMEDFDSENNVFRYPSRGEIVPWLEGYKVVEFDGEKVNIINPDRDVQLLLSGECEYIIVDGIDFELTSNTQRINEMDPISHKVLVYYVNGKDFYDSLEDGKAAYRIACDIEKQTPDAPHIVAKYMQDAADLDSKEAKLWLREYNKKAKGTHNEGKGKDK